MRKIKDERLIIRTLKNIRIAFLVQTVGIIAILIYDMITKGLSGITGNPLWIVLMITIVVFNFLNIRVSTEVYDDVENPKKPGPYYRIVLITALVGFVAGFLQYLYSSNIGEGMLIGGVMFICFLVPFTYANFTRKKQSKDRER